MSVYITREFLNQNQPNSFVLCTNKLDQKNKSSSRRSGDLYALMHRSTSVPVVSNNAFLGNDFHHKMH